MPPHTSRPDSLFETAYTSRDPRQNTRGTLRLPTQLEMRPSSIAPNPVVSREAPSNSTVFLTSNRHPEKLPEVTVTSPGNPGFPSHLEIDLEIPPSPHLEARFPCRDLRAMPCSPSQLQWRLAFPGATREAPEFRVVTREKCHRSHRSSKKNMRFPSDHEMRTSIPTRPRDPDFSLKTPQEA